MKKIAIVGGGLAGLTAAYELLKGGRHEVTLFEAAPVLGGRVQSRKIRGRNVDMGGFLVYPWYKEARRLFDELDLTPFLQKTDLKAVYYAMDGEPPRLESEIPLSKLEALALWTNSLTGIYTSTDTGMPDLDRFDRMTVAEYLRTALKKPGNAGAYESFLDTVHQGYCYGPADESKVAFMAPLIQNASLHGDIEKTSFFPEGTRLVTDRLAERIAAMGGTIRLDSRVLSPSDTADFDATVYAQTVSPELYAGILPDVKPEVRYTRFLAVAVSLSAPALVAGKPDWDMVFFQSSGKEAQQALSAVNLASLYKPELESCVLVYIALGSGTPETISADDIRLIARDEISKAFPETAATEILDHIHWDKTMPIAQEAFVETLRNRQGQDGRYFAGDFMGAPSMEAAIATGAHAAKLVLERV